MLSDQVQESVMHEEMCKFCVCECCEIKTSSEIYLLKNGFCTILAHVCGSCKKDLEFDCMRQNYTYQFLSK
jgi:hypothetical protein